MVLIIIVAFISLILLMVIHELGHFLLAKKFGVKVEEFGIGYPPKIFGKKFGETIYSLNLLPFGAFVRITGESEAINNPRSFSTKPFYQKALIILGGVVSFWIISFLIFTVIMVTGVPTQIDDNETGNFRNPKVQILAVAPNSPAKTAGIKIGDTILKTRNLKSLPAIAFGDSRWQAGEIRNIDKIKDFQDFVSENKGQEIILTMQRGKTIFDLPIVPRQNPPENEGALGVALARTALTNYPWYIAPLKGVQVTFNFTKLALSGWITAITRLVKNQPTGVELMGPVGIFGLFVQAGQMGVTYFFQLVAIISIFVALMNILPIPSTDGGKLLFLIIEKIKGKPISQKITQNIEMAFFSLLIILLIVITIKDIGKLF